MDPLVAAGLVGNIITFVDFSAKVLSRARQLYESANGAIEENDELESLTKNLREFADRIQRDLTQIPQKGHFRAGLNRETVLNNLSQQCIQVADELLESLDSIKVKGDGRTRKSAVQAVKTVWKQDHIDSLQRRLDRISKQLMDGMSMEQLEDINRRLREMAVDNIRLEANRTKEIDQLRRDFNSAIEEIKAKPGNEQVPEAWLMLSDATRRGKHYFAEQVILNSLKFSSIDSRLESIPNEHSETFSWIFHTASSAKFVEWLKGEDGVYWVSGKPGSGKSTLMKFVAAHDETKRYLTEWACDKELVIANYFFWNASTHGSQKSQRGLLRTIIYQIFRQCPKLIHLAYDDQWVGLTSDGKVLENYSDEFSTVPALLRTLRKISTSTLSDTKFCFFVDGLDEYDGRPADIIELIDILMSFPNVKACISSRPWNDFEDRFGNDSPWKLYMQELTRGDIQLYVEDTLGKNPIFKQLQKEDPKCPNFVQSIVHRADGVFLWVSLVTQSLYDGLTNSDRIKDLQKRLNQTPKNLVDYFKTILFSTENLYRTQTAHLFTVAVNTVIELPLMAYWVIDQENPKYVFQCPLETPSDEILHARLRNMKRRLKVLSKGLLEVQPKKHWQDLDPGSVGSLIFQDYVIFSHRTVKDYLKTPDAECMLRSWSDSAFSAHWEICNALGALAKIAPASPDIFASRGVTRGVIWDFAFSLLGYHAPRVDHDPFLRADMTSMLEHLQTVLAPTLEVYVEDFHHTLEDNGRYMNIVEGKEGFETELLVMFGTICFGVLGFVANKFERDPLLCGRVTKNINPLYWSVQRMNDFSLLGNPYDSGMLMLELLLDHGADPNSGSNGITEWRLILESLAWSFDAHRSTPCFDALALLLRYGADFEQQCTSRAIGGSAKACELLKAWYEPDQFALFEDIVRRRETKSKKSRGMSKKIRHLKLWISSKR
jgi:ABC-type Fe3+/spermidine/putrescine transport system ATPase subunit